LSASGLNSPIGACREWSTAPRFARCGPQLVGAIAEAADRVLAEEEEDT
jgi:hypothetical protein